MWKNTMSPFFSSHAGQLPRCYLYWRLVLASAMEVTNANLYEQFRGSLRNRTAIRSWRAYSKLRSRTISATPAWKVSTINWLRKEGQRALQPKWSGATSVTMAELTIGRSKFRVRTWVSPQQRCQLEVVIYIGNLDVIYFAWRWSLLHERRIPQF